MADIEVHIDRNGHTERVGLLCRHTARGRLDAVTFEYDEAWASQRQRVRDRTCPPAHPWLVRNATQSATIRRARGFRARYLGTPPYAARRAALGEARATTGAYTLGEADYLLGVTDLARLGALRFRRVAEE